MRKLFLSFAATTFLALAANVGPAAALPGAGPAAVAMPETGVIPAQMTRRERMMRHRMMRERRMMRQRMRRGRMMNRGAMMRDSGNARNPSRPTMQQQQGQTTGGPRF